MSDPSAPQPEPALPPMAPPVGEPMAPPLSQQHPPPVRNWPATQGTPPYAQGYTAPPANGYPAPAPYAGSPYPVAPSQPVQKGTKVALTVVAVVILLAIIGVGALLVGMVVTNTPTDPGGSSDSAPAEPLPEVEPVPPVEPPAPGEQGSLPLTPGEYISNPSGENIGDQLNHMRDSYLLASEDGSLWEIIPNTEYNQTALIAFRLLLTDMAMAGTFGVSDEDAREYAEDAQTYEELFLAEQPLGTDIDISFSEDRHFRYDGETGEGGYTSE